MPLILPRKNSKNSPGNAKEHRQMVPLKKSRKNAEENTKTLQKLIKTPQTLDTVKLQPHVTAHTYITTTTADPGSQENCSAPGQQR